MITKESRYQGVFIMVLLSQIQTPSFDLISSITWEDVVSSYEEAKSIA